MSISSKYGMKLASEPSKRNQMKLEVSEIGLAQIIMLSSCLLKLMTRLRIEFMGDGMAPERAPSSNAGRLLFLGAKL